MSNLNYCPQCGHKITAGIKFCPDCGNKLVSNVKEVNRQLNNKRERVLAGSKNSHKGKYFGLVTILLIGALIFYIKAKPSKEESIIKQQPKISEAVNYPTSRLDHLYSVAFARDGKIILPLNVVKEKKFMKFDYTGSYTTIPLLAYLTEDGKVVTAISLCEPCDSKSFHIQGSNLICNSCGTTWNLNNLNAISGSCGKYPPDPLPSIVVGNEIQIDENLVINWKRRV